MPEIESVVSEADETAYPSIVANAETAKLRAGAFDLPAIICEADELGDREWLQLRFREYAKPAPTQPPLRSLHDEAAQRYAALAREKASELAQDGDSEPEAPEIPPTVENDLAAFPVIAIATSHRAWRKFIGEFDGETRPSGRREPYPQVSWRIRLEDASKAAEIKGMRLVGLPRGVRRIIAPKPLVEATPATPPVVANVVPFASMRARRFLTSTSLSPFATQH